MKVMIAHPYYRTNFTINFYLGMINTITSFNGSLTIEMGGEYSIVRARNELIKKFLKSDADFLFFVDVDMGLPTGGLTKLVQDNLPIVGALCFQRKPPYNPTLLKEDEITEAAHYYRFIRQYTEGLVEVDATGAGVLLVKREVFEKIPSPWFDEPDDSRSEDIYFCEKARQAGYKIYVDTTVKTTHFTEFLVSEKQKEIYDRQ